MKAVILNVSKCSTGKESSFWRIARKRAAVLMSQSPSVRSSGGLHLIMAQTIVRYIMAQITVPSDRPFLYDSKLLAAFRIAFSLFNVTYQTHSRF
jgi:hypothetical protein